MINKKIALFLLLALISGVSFAQNVITGVVFDDFSKKPLESVKIRVLDSNIGGFSNEKGRFTINYPNGTYPVTLVCSIFGYVTTNYEVKSQSDSIVIRLNPENVKTFEAKCSKFCK